jgi:1-acyl-sn-glycerol-3-phosphate acyltransferase
MIKAKHKKFWELFFDVYIKYNIRKYFRDVRIENNQITSDKNRPVLILANHYSWWDGFWLKYLNKHFLHKKYHVMMLEEQLKSNKFLSYLGAFSIKTNHRSVFYSLQYAQDILQDWNNMLVLFPQGRFFSLHTHHIRFEKGWKKILDKARIEPQVLYVVNLLDYHEYKKPELVMQLKEVKNIRQKDISEVQKEFESFLNECIHLQEEKHASVLDK